MTMSNALENGLLELLLNNAALTGVGDAGGLLPSAADGNLYASLHTADPGEAGSQTTSEAAYTDYARVAITRDGTGWAVVANVGTPAAAITFPEGSGGSGTATHLGIGTASSGAGKLLLSGAISPNIVMGAGITPVISTATTVTFE